MSAGIEQLQRLNRRLLRIDRASSVVSNVCQFAIMIIVVIDVLCRYFFNAPITWAYDVISRYLMVAVFFFALSWTHASGEHVRVLFFRERAPIRLRRVMDLAGSVATLFVFVIILSLGVDRFWQDWTSGAVATGSFLWPNWIASICVPFGAGLMAVRLLLTSVAQAVGVVVDVDVLGTDQDEGMA